MTTDTSPVRLRPTGGGVIGFSTREVEEAGGTGGSEPDQGDNFVFVFFSFIFSLFIIYVVQYI